MIDSRAALVDQLAEVTARFADSEQVPVPPNWGGYRIAPDEVEFWQGREDRLHNRIRVVGGRVERLAALRGGCSVEFVEPGERGVEVCIVE